MTTSQQTLQQKRAASAWGEIEYVSYQLSSEANTYGSLVRGLPALILSDGLGQTLAFLLAKGKGKPNAHQVAYDQLSRWVMGQMGQSGDLLDFVLKVDTAVYRQASAEALAYLQWLKRFAEAKDWQSEND